MPVRFAAAVAVPLTGFLATAELAVETAGVFRAAVRVAAFLAGTVLAVGAVLGPPAQARAPMAMVAAKVARFMLGKQCTRK